VGKKLARIVPLSLPPSPDGPIPIRVTAERRKGRVRVQFGGRSVNWLELTRKQALTFALALRERAQELPAEPEP
jgi:hypothetical protein